MMTDEEEGRRDDRLTGMTVIPRGGIDRDRYGQKEGGGMS